MIHISLWKARIFTKQLQQSGKNLGLLSTNASRAKYTMMPSDAHGMWKVHSRGALALITSLSPENCTLGFFHSWLPLYPQAGLLGYKVSAIHMLSQVRHSPQAWLPRFLSGIFPMDFGSHHKASVGVSRVACLHGLQEQQLRLRQRCHVSKPAVGYKALGFAL